MDHWQSGIPPPTPTGNSIATQQVMDESRNPGCDGQSRMTRSRPNLAEIKDPRECEKRLVMEHGASRGAENRMRCFFSSKVKPFCLGWEWGTCMS